MGEESVGKESPTKGSARLLKRLLVLASDLGLYVSIASDDTESVFMRALINYEE